MATGNGSNACIPWLSFKVIFSEPSQKVSVSLKQCVGEPLSSSHRILPPKVIYHHQVFCHAHGLKYWPTPGIANGRMDIDR